MKGLWLTTKYLAAIVVVVALQIVPATGIFLMMGLALVWAAVLCNLMLLHVGYSAFTSRIERAWLWLPVLTYAGWITFSGIGYFQALALRRSMNAINESIARLSTDERTFVVTPDSVAMGVAEIFKDSRIYGRDRIFERTNDGRCNSKGKSEWKNHGTIPSIMSFDKPPSFSGPYLRFENWCLVSKPAPAPTEGIIVEARELTDSVPFARAVSGRILTIRRNKMLGVSDTIGEIRQASIQFLPPIPMFVAGCFLGEGKWECTWFIWWMTVSVAHSDGYGQYYTEMDYAVSVAEFLGVSHY